LIYNKIFNEYKFLLTGVCKIILRLCSLPNYKTQIKISLIMNSRNELQNNAYDNNDKRLSRRAALTKAGCMTLSVATMMVIMQSQAKAQTSPTDISTMPVAPNATEPTGEWTRTSRSTRI